MIKESSDNYRKSSAECLAIGFCLYIAITFHDGLTEAKIANELIMSVQPLNIERVLFPGQHVWPNLGCYRLFMRGFPFWSITRNEINQSIFICTQSFLLLTKL